EANGMANPRFRKSRLRSVTGLTSPEFPSILHRTAPARDGADAAPRDAMASFGGEGGEGLAGCKSASDWTRLGPYRPKSDYREEPPMRPELPPTAARSARQGRSSAWASAALALALSFGSGCRPAAPGWSGAGAWRILVKVEPADLGKRSSDEGVARLEISFATLLAGQGVDG